MARKTTGIPSQEHAPCDYKRPLPGLGISGNSRPLKSRMGGNDATLEEMQHPIMSVPQFSEQDHQLCKPSATNGKK